MATERLQGSRGRAGRRGDGTERLQGNRAPHTSDTYKGPHARPTRTTGRTPKRRTDPLRDHRPDPQAPDGPPTRPPAGIYIIVQLSRARPGRAGPHPRGYKKDRREQSAISRQMLEDCAQLNARKRLRKDLHAAEQPKAQKGDAGEVYHLSGMRSGGGAAPMLFSGLFLFGKPSGTVIYLPCPKQGLGRESIYI